MSQIRIKSWNAIFKILETAKNCPMSNEWKSYHQVLGFWWFWNHRLSGVRLNCWKDRWACSVFIDSLMIVSLISFPPNVHTFHQVNMTELLGRPMGLFIGLLIGFQFLLSWLFNSYKIRPHGVKLLEMFKKEKEE